MSIFLILFVTHARAAYWFPPDYPGNDPQRIIEIRDLYLRHVQPDQSLPLKTEAGEWNELKIHGAAAGLVIGLELNHRRMSLGARRFTLEAIGLLLLRAIQDRGLMGEPVPDESFRTKLMTFQRFRLTDDDRVRFDFEKLLGHGAISPANRYSAAGFIRAVADGRRLPRLRELAQVFRNEASEMTFHVLARRPPFDFAEFSPPRGAAARSFTA